MSDHLPECQRWFTDMPEPDECPACEMFRACEQRVNGHRLSYENGVEVGYDKGYVAGLDAAREAVAEAPIAIREPAVLLLNRDVALAAIDALRADR